MIQRIQSIYLLLVSLLSGGLIFILEFWEDSAGKTWTVLELFSEKSLILNSISASFWSIALLAMISLFSFKNRTTQININRINIIINFILLGILVYLLLNLSGEMQISKKGIGSFLPLASIVLLVLANRAIQKDEALVKSVDRLR